MNRNRKPIISMLALVLMLLVSGCENEKILYTPAPCPLPTKWSGQVSPETAWPEYPRPQMAREQWLNLNGLWDYSITHKDAAAPDTFMGKILVPYPPESCLSGVGRIIKPDEKLWYRTTFKKGDYWKSDHVLLNFEACDWETTVWINGVEIGTHRGGYDPFSFDITGALNKRGKQEILISVWDPTDTGYQPRGKQVLEPGSIWYTPVSGIWQTIWLEPVHENYIRDFKIFPNLDLGKFQFTFNTARTADSIVVIISEDQGITNRVVGTDPQNISIQLHNVRPWSPEDPFLYGLEIYLYQDGIEMDKIESYAGLRKSSVGKDEENISRLMVNNKFVFQNGPLDQGFWPDGIYTPPTESAMKYDLEVIRQLGFNMLRKHVKVENRRFYYWCDKMGLLVWQDMPSGFRSNDTTAMTGSEKQQFELELAALVNTHFNAPSIIMWVPFNEGWGQYETPRIVDLVRDLDPTRLINNASGWNDRNAGDVLDWHHYPEPVAPQPEETRAAVLGEFGGLGYYVEGHTWQEENWGYKKMTSIEELTERYVEFYGQVSKYKNDPGLSASIYTQITDVETETNGLMTYDREVIKMEVPLLRETNRIK